MKILMFGRGVVAVLYGWALEKAGHSVDFYVRPGRAAAYGRALPLRLLDARVKARGVLVEESWPLRLREDLPADHDYELIIVSVQHYQFREAAAFLSSRAGRATLLIFSNFWDDLRAAAAALPAGQLAWGFPQAGGAVEADSTVVGSLFGKVWFGTFGTAPTDREVAVRDLFRQSGFQLVEDRDWRGWLWTHFAVNAGLFAQAWRAGSPGRVVASAAQCRAAARSVRELLPVVAARGISLEARAASVRLYRLPPWLGGTLLWLLFKVSPPLRVMVESYANGEEQRRTCHDVLLTARQLGVAVPRLEAAAPLFAEVPAP